MRKLLAFCLALCLLAGCTAPPPEEESSQWEEAESQGVEEVPSPQEASPPEEPPQAPEEEESSQAPPPTDRGPGEAQPPTPEEREEIVDRERTHVSSGEQKGPRQDHRDALGLGLAETDLDPEENDLPVSLEEAYQVINENLGKLDYVPDRYFLECSGIYAIGEAEYYIIAIFNRDLPGSPTDIGQYCVDTQTGQLFLYESDGQQHFLIPLTE